MTPVTDAWWSYTRAPEYDVVGTTIDVPVRDGITIACDVRRPARDGEPVEDRFPCLVVEFSPYAVLRDFYLGEAVAAGERAARERHDPAAAERERPEVGHRLHVDLDDEQRAQLHGSGR
jgi:hypothetical protein